MNDAGMETETGTSEQSEFTFSADELREIDGMKDRYPEAQAAVMPVLWLAQQKWGWLPEGAMRAVADVLDLPEAHVRGVATFYTMYWKKPMGQRHIQVCTNISCNLRGAEEIYAAVKERLGVGHMEATDDGRFSVEEVECMGACGGAPMIAINADYHENVTVESLLRLLGEQSDSSAPSETVDEVS